MQDSPPTENELDRRLQEAKLRSLVEFAAGAGHEINNPLATIAGRAQLLLRSETVPDRRRNLAMILSQTLRIRDMIGDLMVYAHPPEPQPQRCELSTLASQTVDELTEHANLLDCSIHVHGHTAFVFADPQQIRVALGCVLRNALEAAGSGGQVEVETSDGDTPTVTIVDSGPGFSSADREHAFDPFYSGRQAGRGLGFGLCKVWRIVTLARGEVTIDTADDGRTRVRLSFPQEAAP